MIFMQNRAKIIIPLVVLLIVIVAIATCTGNSSIFVQWEPVAIQSSNNSVKLKVYIENSGSMDGYMRQKSEFKDAVKSYVNALDLKVDTTELYYINTQISSFKADIAKFEEALNPASFAKCAGSRSNSDIAVFRVISVRICCTGTCKYNPCFLTKRNNTLCTSAHSIK